MEKYIVDIISATRYPEKYDEDLKAWIDYGASPRGTIGIPTKNVTILSSSFIFRIF